LSITNNRNKASGNEIRISLYMLFSQKIYVQCGEVELCTTGLKLILKW